MSQNEHDTSDTIQFDTPKQVITLLALTALVPIVIIVLVTQFITNVRSVDKNSAAMTPDAVAKRLKPVGEVVFADAASVAATTATPGGPAGKAAGAVAAPAAAAGKDGKKIYDASCAVCHGAGVAGAPKLGDKTAWAPRSKAGAGALHASALKGKGAMPAKGGNAALDDADVKAAVDYLLGAAK